MSNDAKILDQNPVAQALPPVQTGFMRKEQAPPVVVEPNLSEFIKPEIEKPNVDQEQKDMGVVAKSDKPDLTFEHKELGMVHSGPNVTVPPAPTGLVQISEKKDVSNSLTWFNALWEKVLKWGNK